ncbi:MAG TPA: RING finger protein, partial [Clostridiales bacterium]|nr:RING finger protein [Clostridiales bacterium]
MFFNVNDDIVVCPECATPQHRECWQKNNRCVNAEHHAPGFVWTPLAVPQPEEDAFDPAKDEGVICAVCGANNPKDYVVCAGCGSAAGAPAPGPTGAADRFAGFAARGFNPDVLSTLFASDDWYTTGHSSATALPTFLGNHDMGRVGNLVRNDPDGLARSELAHSLMFL